MLVAAVLGPEEREHRELEIVRRTLEQLLDTLELPVGETEGLVERLLCDRAQGVSVSAVPDVESASPARASISHGGLHGRWNYEEIMSRRHTIMLFALAAIWGASFMFIKVAVRELEPLTLVWLRLSLAAIVLVPVALLALGREAVTQFRAAAGRLAILGLANSVLPFTLLSWAEIRLDSGVAAILQGSAPLFTALISFRYGTDRIGGMRLVGVLVGFVGRCAAGGRAQRQRPRRRAGRARDGALLRRLGRVRRAPAARHRAARRRRRLDGDRVAA